MLAPVSLKASVVNLITRRSRMRRASAALRSAFQRPRTLFRLEFPGLPVLFEAGIVIFPPGPGAAASSMESNCAELPTFIVAPVAFPLGAGSPPFSRAPPNPPLIFPDDATFALDKVWTPAFAVLLEDEAGGSVKDGAFASGCGSRARLPPNDPFDELPGGPV